MIQPIAEVIATGLKVKDPKIYELKFIARKNIEDQIVLDGRDAGLNDTRTGYGYIRFLSDQDHFYEEVVQEKKFSSDSRGYLAARSPLRLVICHKYANEYGYEWFIIDALRNLNINVPAVPFDNPQIKILSSSKDKERIYEEETGKTEENTTNQVINLLSVDFEVTWNMGPCQTTNFNPNECE